MYENKKVMYEDILANIADVSGNPIDGENRGRNWKGWKDVFEIIDTKRSLSYPDRVEHTLCFLNTWLRENCVQRMFNLSYIDNDHDYLTNVPNSGSPDFRTIDGRTVEFKSFKYKDGAYKRPASSWHGADVRLVHIRTERALYVWKPDIDEWTFICNFNPLEIFIETFPYTEKDIKF